jgi:poly-gamma-glutamate synthesis protein (capsule biosynthesis protein)
VPTLRTQGWDYPWTGLDGIFEKDDLSILNFECPVAPPGIGSKLDKEFAFLCDPRGLPAMRRAGVEVASLANNHAYDYGPEALLASIGEIEDAGMTPLGAGEDDRAAEEPAIFNLKGWRVAVVPWDYVVDPWPTAVAAPNHPGTAFGHDFKAVERAVGRIDPKVDLTIVQTHWGVELETQPNPGQVTLGHRLIDAGADVIFGGHSHRLQPLEIYKDKPIFWSLGNFVWPNFSAAGSQTGVAEVTIKPNGQIKAKLLPATITAPGHPDLR